MPAGIKQRTGLIPFAQLYVKNLCRHLSGTVLQPRCFPRGTSAWLVQPYTGRGREGVCKSSGLQQKQQQHLMRQT